jgi:NAD-dependent DNA ligase
MSKKGGSRSLAKPLDGYCFAITGALSVSRQEFETLIQHNGGEIAKSVTKKCTHLVSAMTGTKKCQDAEAKGLQVVDEEWVREKILSSGGTEEKPMKKMKLKSSPTQSTTRSSQQASSSSTGTLSGLVFAITGTLSVSRKEFENFILANGGKVAKSVTKNVTHLVRYCSPSITDSLT